MGKKMILSVIELFCACMVTGELSGQQPSENHPETVLEKDFFSETRLRIECIHENILRIQIIPQEDAYHGSALNRYGFIRDIDTDDLKVEFSENGNGSSVVTSGLKLTANNKTGEILITDPSGDRTLFEHVSADFTDSSSRVVCKAGKRENWIGFGDQSRERLYHRGHIADCHVQSVKSYIPVPFFMSTRGVGVLVNTSHRVSFDMCHNDPDLYSWEDESGYIDYYVMRGADFRELIDLYTELTGKPKLPPEWSFGLWYLCHTRADDYEVVNEAYQFRKLEIPCDVIGLEPGWMEIYYDYSIDKTWNSERFPIPRWAPNGPHTFLSSLKRMGFKVELWLCNDYDLTYEEERRIGNSPGASCIRPSFKEARDSRSDEPGIEEMTGREGTVENFLLPAQWDTLTRKDVPWFDHLEKFVDQGADFFKQDGAKQVHQHPGRIWGNGMTDAEVHNLYPVMYSRQMYEGFAEHTNRRPVVFTDCGWTGFQAWSGTWTGDTGGRLTTLGGMLNTSIVGHSWATNDMEVAQKEGIHFGYLLPWSQINSWYYFRMPWLQGQELLSMHQYYARLRSRLVPYLYSWAYVATRTGWPMLVPLTLEFPEDRNCCDNLHQYLLGRDLMVGIYENELYFPSGQWKDYWTGEVISGSRVKEVSWPAERGGALYVRSGGIIPLGPQMQYRGEKPLDEISLYVFPGQKESCFELYEDDGVSFDHMEGEYTITRISAQRKDHSSTIMIGEYEGDFKGILADRRWNIIVHAGKHPVSVMLDEMELPGEKYSWDGESKELTIKNITAPADITIKDQEDE